MVDNPTYLVALGAFASACIAAVGLFMNASATKKAYKLDTMTFVTNQFDYLDQSGARQEVRNIEGKNILEHINGDTKLEQKLKQCIFAYNRIAAGIHHHALDQEVVFSVWPKTWFQEQYKIFEPLIKHEQQHRRKDVYQHFCELVR